MLKWKLMVTTLPFVIVAVGVKLVLGTMADYKESEKLPVELFPLNEYIERLERKLAAGGKPTA